MCLVDATAFCYRAFYALRNLSTSYGQPTNAVFGFVKMIKKIIDEYRPDYIAVCFDVSRDTFRSKKFAEYKMQRPSMPDSLVSQIPLIKEVVSAFGLKLVEKEGFEADDLIATLARKAASEKFSVTIISSDKDILQLVDGNIKVFSPYKDEGVTYDTDKVKERFGVDPALVPDVIALMGDESDNIPGVAGIGEKTASRLINEFGTLDNLIENRQNIDKEKLRKTIAENLEKIELNRQLVRLKDDVALDFDLADLAPGEADAQELVRIFKKLEFRSLLKELGSGFDKETQKAETEELGDSGLKDLLYAAEEMAISAEVESEMVISAKGRLLRVVQVEAGLRQALADPRIRKIGHDLKKAVHLLKKKGITLRGLSFDTMIAAYLLNSAGSTFALPDLALNYLGKMVREPLAGAERAGLILELKPVLEGRLEENSLFSLFKDIEMPLTEVLSDIEDAGIALDVKVLSGLSADIEKRLIKLIEEIYDLSGVQFNINSPKQLREILFERLKLPVVKRSKTGPSTDEEVLRKLADKHELPKLLLEYRQLMKLKTTYIDVLPQLIDKDSGRLHTSFNQTGTETGRLSSQNPNLQNVPVRTDIGRQIRRAIIAGEKDSCLISCDYSQIELRVLAHLSKDEALIDAFKRGADIHRATAALIYGTDEGSITDEIRETAKRVNFGIVYGLTAYGLSRDLNIPVDQAQAFIDAYFQRYPRVKEYIETQIKSAEKNGFVATIMGRRRYIPQINDRNQAARQFAQRQAVNTPIQGSASDLIKMAMINIHRQLKSSGLETRMVLQIHDELLFEGPQREVKQVLVSVKDKMENVMQLEVPVRIDIKKGMNWLEMEPVR